jgi:hypothetical protein
VLRPLHEIDPACADDRLSVLELVSRHDAGPATQAMLLPTFMDGFLFGLLRTKWARHGRAVYAAMLAALGAYTGLLTLLAAPSVLGAPLPPPPLPPAGAAGAAEARAAACAATPLACFVASRRLPYAVVGLGGALLALDVRETAAWAARRMQRKHRPPRLATVCAMLHERQAELRYASVVCATAACGRLLLAAEDGPPPPFELEGGRALPGPSRAHVRESEGVRLLLAAATLLAWLLLLADVARPFPRLGIYVKLIRKFLAGDVSLFLLIYAPLLAGFAAAMTAVWPAEAGWASARFAHYCPAAEALFLLSLVGEPPDVGRTAYPTELGAADGLGGASAAFAALYVGFVLLVPILLVNLLIALLTSTYQATLARATLEWRLEFARLVLRMELLLPACGAVRRAGDRALGSDYVAVRSDASAADSAAKARAAGELAGGPPAGDADDGAMGAKWDGADDGAPAATRLTDAPAGERALHGAIAGDVPAAVAALRGEIAARDEVIYATLHRLSEAVEQLARRVDAPTVPDVPAELLKAPSPRRHGPSRVAGAAADSPALLGGARVLREPPHAHVGGGLLSAGLSGRARRAALPRVEAAAPRAGVQRSPARAGAQYSSPRSAHATAGQEPPVCYL